MIKRLSNRLLLSAVVASMSSFVITQSSASGSNTSDKVSLTFGAPLQCKNDGKILSVFAIALETRKSSDDTGVEVWVLNAMKAVGVPASIPTSHEAHDAALQVATMLRQGHIVAAKMGNDEASLHIPSYKKAEFSKSFEALLTVSTQPIMHGIESADEKDISLGKKNVDGNLDQASHSLAEIIRRADVTKTAMGQAYDMPSIRYYLLANGFRDALALRSASTSVCSLNLSPVVLKKLNASARYMALGPSNANKGLKSGIKK